ncbi:MAG: dihydrofolate reductase family protein [Solirubrobacteraceae bacterium]
MHAMGRVTYNEMAAHWPVSTDEYAAPMNDVPEVVFSKTLASADWNDSRVARGDIAEEISAMRLEPGGDIIAWGGASFVQALSRQGLVDEYRLVINPVALGNGLPLFKDLSDPIELQLVEARTFASGAALHVYQPRAWIRLDLPGLPQFSPSGTNRVAKTTRLKSCVESEKRVSARNGGCNLLIAKPGTRRLRRPIGGFINQPGPWFRGKREPALARFLLAPTAALGEKQRSDRKA